MGRADLRFYAGLRALLATGREGGRVEHRFVVPGTVKDAIEACGVPHTEVDLILINGESVGFSERIADGDRISVFPRFTALDVTSLTRVRPPELARWRFVLDGHLRKLAAYLRLLGFDAQCDGAWSDHDLAGISAAQGRMLLTRDIGLLKHASVVYGAFVRATDPLDQLLEVVERLQLSGRIDPFTRCMRCNGELVPVAKAAIAERIPPRTRDHVDDYRMCGDCGNLYWEGAHHPRLREIVDAARRVGASGAVASAGAGGSRGERPAPAE